MPHTESGRKRLGRYVIATRRAAGMNRSALSRDSGLSYRILGDVERGDRAVSEGTYALIEQALGWAPGDCGRIEAGEEPTPRDSDGPGLAEINNAKQAMRDAYKLAAQMIDVGDVELGTYLTTLLTTIRAAVPR